MEINSTRINSGPERILNEYFGYDGFRENQREIIETVMGGEDAFVLMPTGSGKSICYQIPSMLKQGVGIVYARTRKRTESIAEWLSQQGVDALPYHAGLPTGGAHGKPEAVSGEQHAGDCGHRRIRYGYRQTGCSVCGSPGFAFQHGSVLPGNGACRP